jgi:hypothetical protein
VGKLPLLQVNGLIVPCLVELCTPQDGSVEFCMGEVTDVMALTDLLVNHASTITVGSTTEKVPINVNGKVLMYGYSHGGCALPLKADLIWSGGAHGGHSQ